ncbi:VWA domain-containing protein [Streptomyces sp. NPDC090442]|uniref:VWA domain-containing protein n=1 Tax=Streptomyces sp. NPDC090442 TaxID=3365962 RepID=UPI0037FAEC48
MFKNLFGSTSTAPQVAPSSSVIDLTKKAKVSLDKHGLTGQRAAVYLVLDRSGSMRPYYKDGTLQHLAEQALGLSANLDDDGTVPVVFFSTKIDGTTEVTLDNYAGRIEQVHQRLGHMGLTYYEHAIQAVIEHYQASGATDPAFVIFQTDGSPSNRAAAARALRSASNLPLFWVFVGFGKDVAFLEKLDDLSGRAVDNAGFFHALDPHLVTDEEFYAGITADFGPWLAAARGAGILH